LEGEEEKEKEEKKKKKKTFAYCGIQRTLPVTPLKNHVLE
jgi:hypothetical protein